MQVPREQVLTFLESRGKGGQAAQAGSGLPEVVDTERDADLLQSIGADPTELAATFEGGEPDL